MCESELLRSGWTVRLGYRPQPRGTIHRLCSYRRRAHRGRQPERLDLGAASWVCPAPTAAATLNDLHLGRSPRSLRYSGMGRLPRLASTEPTRGSLPHRPRFWRCVARSRRVPERRRRGGWSSSTMSSDIDRAWVVRAWPVENQDSLTNWKATAHAVRCVRGVLPPADWSGPRQSRSGSPLVVTDQATDLMWHGCPLGTSGADCASGNNISNTWYWALNAVRRALSVASTTGG